jgi:hypothetical protein
MTHSNFTILKLEGQEISIGLKDYSLKPLDRLLRILVWMAGGKLLTNAETVL